jgi:uncharacterized membrane protein
VTPPARLPPLQPVVPLTPEQREAALRVATLLGQDLEALDARSQRVAHHIAQRTSVALQGLAPVEVGPTPGQRAADTVAAFGGSWTFVSLFAVVMVLWVLLNGALLWGGVGPFDPYPYILLNLFLSMLAAIQAPIILMSQNRQSEKDRAAAGHDYEVNLKAELQIMLLHEKMDALRQQQWGELLAMQREQLRLLAVREHPGTA